jgi:hypothetical protein
MTTSAEDLAYPDPADCTMCALNSDAGCKVCRGFVPTDSMQEPIALFSRENIDTILSIVPSRAKACYTGQSILAYCPNPTFDWAELNTWPDVTDVDIFCYNKATLASCVQSYINAGWMPASEIDEFKADRIRFWEPTGKYKNTLQTVGLSMSGLPNVNLTWHPDSGNVVSTIQRFDMDYLMVGMDLHTKVFIDLRGPDHRIANVNRLNAKFDVDDVDVMFWLRQFDRIPKGYARGVDTRPVARTYLGWLEETISRGDRGVGSKTRFYAERKMAQSIEVLTLDGLFTQQQAERMYHLFRHEDQTWEAMALNLNMIHKQITEWLASVADD